MEMYVIVNPYYRSVEIDGEEVKQVVLPFPDYLNHLASISCTYDDSNNSITDVQSIHRYVSHFVEKEYYFDHLATFVSWFHAEKAAQAAKTEADLEALGQAVRDYIEPLLDEIDTRLINQNVTNFYYNANLRTMNLVKGTLTTLTTLIPEVTDTRPGLMTAADILALRDLQVKVNSLVAQGVWRATFTDYATMINAYPGLVVNNTNWQENDFIFVDSDENYNPDNPVRTSYIVVLRGTNRLLEFRKTENMEAVSQATNESFGVVKGTADRKGGIYVETNGEMSLNGWDELEAHTQSIFLTEEDFAASEDPEGSGLYPSFIGRMVVIQQ